MSDITPVTVDIDGTSYRLDWQLRHDAASLPYKIDQHFSVDKKLRNRRWTRLRAIDQGVYKCPICRQHGACTGYSAAHALATTPRAAYNITDEMAHQIYHEAQKRDQWHGENYEGSSVLGAMSYLKEVGVLKDYFWATTLNEVLSAISHYGALVIGINWYEGMFRPDKKGYIEPTGRLAGGHAIELSGINVNQQDVELPNSWGLEWGLKGVCRMRWEVLGDLLAQQGEFALPRKVRGRSVILPQAA